MKLATGLLALTLAAPAAAQTLEDKIRQVTPILDSRSVEAFAPYERKRLEIELENVTEIPEALYRIAAKKKIPLEHLSSYVELAKLGVNEEFLSDVDPGYLHETLQSIRSGRYPLELFEDYELWGSDYSARAAARDEYFTSWESVDKESVREYIKHALGKREHAKRTVSDYSENASQIDGINDPIILLLAKRYVDYFNSADAWSQIVPLFDDPSRGERGGFILGDEKLRFVEIKDTSMEKTSGSYSEGKIALKYLQRLGSLHTHPKEGENPNEFAGPSGWAKVANGDVPTSDIAMLRYFAGYFNNFFIDSVVTEMGAGRYNVDIYFRDVVRTEKGGYKNHPIVTVIDLGVYEPAERK